MTLTLTELHSKAELTSPKVSNVIYEPSPFCCQMSALLLPDVQQCGSVVSQPTPRSLLPSEVRKKTKNRHCSACNTE